MVNSVLLFSQDWKQVIQEKGSTVCLIEIYANDKVKSSGSGFLISEDGLILTNAHVVKSSNYSDGYSVKVKFTMSDFPEKEYEAKIMKYSEDLDISVIKIDGHFSVYNNLEKLGNAQIMDDIMVVGYPLGKNIKATPGVIQSIQSIDNLGEMLDISVDVDPGNSGGPVFNEDGDVVGIVTAELWGYNFNLAIPSYLVNKYINSSTVDDTLKVNTTPSEARVYVNGTFKGLSPIDIKLYGSSNEIMVEKESYKTKKLSIEQDNDSNELDIELEKKIASSNLTILIDSKPSNAVVLIDNVEVGKTPLSIDVISGSKLRIRLKKSWYKEFYTELIPTSDSELKYFYKLSRW